MAKLKTTNKSAVYNNLKSELYKNVNDIMRDAYKKAIDTRAQLEDENSPTFIGNIFRGTVGTIGGVGFDILKGVLSSIGSATNGVVQSLARFSMNVGDIFDETDGRGWEEDLAYTISSMGGNLIKGLGSAGLSLGGLGGELLGIEGSAEFAQEQTRKLENFVNTDIIGAAVEEARTGNMLGRIGSQFLLGDTPEGMGRQDVESEFDDADFVKQYINSRWDESSAAAQVSRWATNQNATYQSFIEPIGQVLDEYVDKSFLGEIYSKYLEPAATSIGELVPSLVLSSFAPKVGSSQTADAINAMAKAYFVSKAYGSAHQEAIERGTTPSDAHNYAIAIAGVELATESIGGFVPGKTLATSYKNVLKSMGTEFLEEFTAEIIQPGLNFWLDEERNYEEISRSELFSRAVYAGTIGGISGGVFGGIGALQARTSPEANIEALNREFNKKAEKRNDRVIAQQISNLERNLNDPNIPKWRKDQILNDPLYNEVIRQTNVDTITSPMSIIGSPSSSQQSNVGTKYELTEVGRRMAEGQMLAKQGETTISKDEYAVGSQEFVIDYKDEILGQKVNILKNEEVETLNEAQQKDIKWFRDRNLRVAFVKQSEMPGQNLEVPAFTDLETGIVYINVSAQQNEQGFKNAFAHEFHDKINELTNKGLVTTKQFEAYNNFIESINEGALDIVLEQIGFDDVLDFYMEQIMTPEQKKVAQEEGVENVQLTDEQQRIIAREKISAVIAGVFDNENLLRDAFGRQPNLFRRIANLFSNTQKFQKEFNVQEDSVINDMLTNMQNNFRKLLKEGSEFAFGSRTVGEGLAKRVVYSPMQFFTNEVFMAQYHKRPLYPENQDDLDLITNNEELMFELIGYKPEYNPNIEQMTKEELYLNRAWIVDFEYFRKNRPTMIKGSSLESYYSNIPNKDYFLKVGRKIYDRNKFRVPEGARDFNIQFIDNNYFEINYKFEPRFESEEDSSLVVDGGLFTQRIYPDVQKSDGTIVENPIILMATMNPERINFLMENGVLPNQSINLQSATSMGLNTRQFESIFKGEKDHEFTITLSFASRLVRENGFLPYTNDIFSPVVIFPNSEESLFGDSENKYREFNVDPKKEVIMKTEQDIDAYFMLEGSKRYLSAPIRNKQKALQQTLNVLIYQAGEKLQRYGGVSSLETVNSNLLTTIQLFNSISNTTSSKYTEYTLKKMINNKQSYTPQELFDLSREAARAIYVVLNGMDEVAEANRLNVFGKMLDSTIRTEFKTTYTTDSEAIEMKNKYKSELEAIARFMNSQEFAIHHIAEAKHPKITPEFIEAAYITHLKENKSSDTYNRIRKYFEENGIVVRDIVNDKIVEDAVYSDIDKTNFLETLEYHQKLNDGENSLVQSALEDGLDGVTNVVFMAVKKSSSAKKGSTNTQRKYKAKRAVKNVTASETVKEQQIISKSQTKTTKKKVSRTQQEDAVIKAVRKLEFTIKEAQKNLDGQKQILEFAKQKGDKVRIKRTEDFIAKFETDIEGYQAQIDSLKKNGIVENKLATPQEKAPQEVVEEGTQEAPQEVVEEAQEEQVEVVEETTQEQTQEVVEETQEQAPQQQVAQPTPKQAPTPSRTMTAKEFVELQDNGKQQTDKQYKQLNKDFVKFLDEVYPKIQGKKQYQYKQLVELYKKYESIIRKDVRGGKYINHVTSAVLKNVIIELQGIYSRIEKSKNRKSLRLNDRELERVVRAINEAIFGSIKYMESITSKRYISETNPTGMIYAKYSHWFLREFLEADLTDAKTLNDFADEDNRGDFFRRLLNAAYQINSQDGFKEFSNAFDEFLEATDIEKVSDLSLRENDTQRTQSDVLKQWVSNAKNIDRVKKAIKYNTLLPSGYSSLVDPYSFLEIQGLFNKNSWSSVLYRKIIKAQEDMIEIDRIFQEVINTQDWIKANYKEIKKMESKRHTYKINGLNGVEVPMSQIIFLRNMIAREIVRNKAIASGIIEGNLSNHFDAGNVINLLNLTQDNTQKFDKRTNATIVEPLDLLLELDGLIRSNDVASEYNQKILELFSRLYPYVNERFVETNGQPLQNEGIEIKQAFKEMKDDEVEAFFSGLPFTINKSNIDKIYVPIYVGNAGYFKEDSVNVQNIIDLGVFDGMTQSISEEADSAVKVDSITNVLYKYNKEVRNYYGLHRIMSDWNNVINSKIQGEVQSTNLKAYISEQAVRYVEELLKDIAGYAPMTAGYKTRKSLEWLRTNFYRAALAANLKVIFTQLTTIYNLSVLYAPNPATFFPKMYKNLFMQLSPKNKATIQEMENNNNIYWNRSFQPTFDIGEATKDGLSANNQYSRFINLLMSGITITDNAINKAFYLTLLETTNPLTNSLYTVEEANEKLNEGILRSQSSALDLSKAPILRSKSDLTKMLVKFMGEPLKLQSQIYMQYKKLDFIRKTDNKAEGLQNELDQEEANALVELQDARIKLDSLRKKETDPSFATMDFDEQMAIRDEISEQEVVVKELEKAHDEVSSIVSDIKDQMDLTLASRSETRNGMIRRMSALMGAMTYMAGLGVLWSAILSDMGRLDDREEEEELANYLSRKMGVAIGGEFAGLFPYIRDLYGFFVEGYDFANIDELALLQQTATTIQDLTKKITSKEDVNWYEVARDISVFGARTFGFPASNIEKFVVLGMLGTGNQDDYYRYRSITGQRTASNKELSQAVIDGRDDLVQAIVETRISARQIMVSQPVSNEITKLARVGSNVTMTGVNDSYTIDGVEYNLDERQKIRFRSIYNQADIVIQRLLTSASYKRLNDKNKASILKSIYNYYLRYAQQEVLGVDVLSEARTFRTLNQSFQYFRDTVANSLYNKQRKERNVQ